MIKFKRIPKNNITEYMFVDPGFHTGITYWETKQVYRTCELNIDYTLVNKKAFVQYKHTHLWKKFNKVLNKFNPQYVVFEDVTVRNDKQSILSAKSGNLLKLDRLLGGYQGICVMLRIPYSTRRVVDWKGNMNDEQVQHRIKWLTGLEFDSPHIADSFGMSLNEMSIFK